MAIHHSLQDKKQCEYALAHDNLAVQCMNLGHVKKII